MKIIALISGLDGGPFPYYLCRHDETLMWKEHYDPDNFDYYDGWLPMTYKEINLDEVYSLKITVDHDLFYVYQNEHLYLKEFIPYEDWHLNES